MRELDFKGLDSMRSAIPMSSALPRARGSLLQSLAQRQICPRKVLLEYPYLGQWTSVGTIPIPGGGMILTEDSRPRGPPLAISFTKERGYGHYLAVADEDGYVGIYNTSFPFQGTVYSREDTRRSQIVGWLAHTNSIFDVCCIKEDAFMLTASGDQTIKVWDVDRKTEVGVMKGHNGSVKSLCVNPTQPDVFVSGSRDGSMAFWDLRTPAAVHSETNECSYRPVAKVDKAHKVPRAKACSRQVLANSVTAVLYLKDARTVASGGANDGVVKYWDTRKLKAPVAQTPPEGPEVVTGRNGFRMHGTAALSQDSTGRRLIAACVDSKIYMYDVMRPERGALATFSGHMMDSFYIKAAFSPDGSHILSGSSDDNAYIWKVDDPAGYPTVLKGHDSEVTAVSWCQTDFCKVATCSDDYTVCIWAISEPQFGQRVIKDPQISTQLLTSETGTSAVSPSESSPSSELRGEFQKESVIRINPNSEDTLQTTDAAVLSFGTSHNSLNKEATPTSKRLKVSQHSPVGKENMTLEDQQELESPQLKISTSPFSVLSPPGSTSRRRKTILDYFGVQQRSSEASANNHDYGSRTQPNKSVRRV